jgi:hypothetical protein
VVVNNATHAMDKVVGEQRELTPSQRHDVRAHLFRGRNTAGRLQDLLIEAQGRVHGRGRWGLMLEGRRRQREKRAYLVGVRLRAASDGGSIERVGASTYSRASSQESATIFRAGDQERHVLPVRCERFLTKRQLMLLEDLQTRHTAEHEVLSIPWTQGAATGIERRYMQSTRQRRVPGTRR